MPHPNKVVDHASQDVEAANCAEPAASGHKPVWSQAIGNPAPLGLLAFGVTTTLLMSVDAVWSGKLFVGAVMGYAYAYGGFAQMVAGVLELLKGNTFAGTAFFSYGGFWISWSFINTMLRMHGDLAAFQPDHGFKIGQTFMLALWGLFTFGFFILTLRKNKCLITVFGSLFITFFLLAGGVWNVRVNTAAGYIGVFCGLSAMYAAFAELYEEGLGIQMPGLAPVRYI